MERMTKSWLAEAVSAFGAACQAKLAGPGDREAAIRAPLEGLLQAAGRALKVPAVFHDEVRDSARQVRPDYGVAVAGAMTGYVEVKAPGRPIDPLRFTGHDRRQWERQQDLPNLLYTNGTEWRLYRDGKPHGEPVSLAGDLLTAGDRLQAPAQLEQTLIDFLRWKPAPITSVGALVRAVAPLTRLLRGEVLDQLKEEQQAIRAGADKRSQPFTGLATDWRTLLFPSAGDEVFADGYAQTVTFALLLARTEGISLESRSLHEVGADLGVDHSLMGRALQLLTDAVEADFKVTLDLLVRVIGAVDWARVRRGKRDTYLHLYENFLEQYDPDLRQDSGSYYTPRDVVEHMIRLTEQAITDHLDHAAGFLDPSVVVVDPAMGTGTYLHTIIDRSIEQITAADGPGAVPGGIVELARRLYGFEIQMGPYAVAELRTADLLARHGASPGAVGANLYVTDTLDDPESKQPSLGSTLELIAQSRRRANKVKAHQNVTVVIGNPPYRERAEGLGGWVENGSPASGRGRNADRPVLDDFREAGNGQNEYVLKNLYVYFWRWATWKVFESTPADDAGVVCFITTAGYLRGPGFKGMRRYLRTWASRGWVIDVTPEGQTPEVATRIFPGVRQPLAIALFVRTPEKDPGIPARISYRTVEGRRADKFSQLAEIHLEDEGWRDVRTDWTATLTPAAEGEWDDYPALNDLFPWTTPGVKPNRTWVYAPSPDILRDRWNQLVGESDPAQQAELFKTSRDSSLTKAKQPLPRGDTHMTSKTLEADPGPFPKPWPIAYRALDRQWIIPDSRLIDQPRPPLWETHQPGQVYLVEQHAQPVDSGPGVIFTTHVPDMHCFNGRGGRVLPLLHPDGTPNLAPGFLDAWAAMLTRALDPEDVLAYVAAVTAHPGFTTRFADELTTPGIRVPVSSDPDLVERAIRLGRQVVRAWTYCEAFPEGPASRVRYPAGDPRQPLCVTDTSDALPERADYDPVSQTLSLASKTFAPVTPRVWSYDVGGMNVIRSWVKYRKADPGGRKSSPLDHIHVQAWPQAWTREFIDLLTVLDRLTRFEQDQAELLDAILAGPRLSVSALRAARARWPSKAADRRPRLAVTAQEGQLDIQSHGTDGDSC